MINCTLQRSLKLSCSHAIKFGKSSLNGRSYHLNSHVLFLLSRYWLWEERFNSICKGIFGIREFTEIHCGIRENAKILEGIRDLTPQVQFWEGPELYYPYSGSVFRPNLGMGWGIGKETVFGLAMAEVRDAGLSCKRSGNAGSGHPPPNHPPPPPPPSLYVRGLTFL